MTRLVLTLGALLLAGPVLAQSEPEGKALQLKVRPSGYDAVANEAQARQEKLLKRLGAEQSHDAIDLHQLRR